MLVEFLLVPGIGVAGILGLGSLAGACWYSFVSAGTHTGMIVTAIVLLIVVVMVLVMLRSKTWKKLELKTEIDSSVEDKSSLVKPGDRGVAVTRLAPMGKASFGQTECEVKSQSFVDPLTPVVVVSVDDKEILVKPDNNQYLWM